MSDWSPWGACSKTCNDGLQTRSRTVLVEQEGNGRTCPTLTAQQPCREKLCGEHVSIVYCSLQYDLLIRECTSQCSSCTSSMVVLISTLAD